MSFGTPLLPQSRRQTAAPYDPRTRVQAGQPRAAGDASVALERANADGADLALRTLRELLRRGRPPEWNRLVMGSATDSQREASARVDAPARSSSVANDEE